MVPVVVRELAISFLEEKKDTIQIFSQKYWCGILEKLE